MQTVRCKITREQFNIAVKLKGMDFYDYATNHLNPAFAQWWVYGIRNLWVEEEPKESKYWLCARIGDSCD